MATPVDSTSHGGSRGGTPVSGTSACHPAGRGWREEMIRHTAYLRSQQRTACPGKEIEDWLAAEREVDELIACGGAPYA